MKSGNSAEEVALHNCEREPVHIPGRIQPFGALAGFDLHSKECTHASENLASAFGDSVELGANFESALTSELRHAIRGALGLPTISEFRERIGSYKIGSHTYDVAVHTVDETCVLEFEQLTSASESVSSGVARVRALSAMLELDKGSQRLLESAVNAIRMATGYDRVMAYKFLEGGEGEVVAEARSPGVDPFLGLRYPAYDIPPQVRRIALKSPFRIIAEASNDGFDIQSNRPAPLDLSLAHVRAVSPIHVEYLSNMGVGATMNVSIIVRGELWGLLAFHHYLPRHPHPDQRSICELFGQLLSLQIQQELEKEILSQRQRVTSTCGALRQATGIQIADAVTTLSSDLMNAVAADGLILKAKGELTAFGHVPTEDVVNRLLDVEADMIFAADSLSSLPALGGQDLGSVAGVLRVHLAASSYLFFFRDETISHVRWGGMPDGKRIEYGPNGPRLHPRASFEEYRESVKGRCKPWSKGAFSTATDIRAALLEMLAASKEQLKGDAERTLRQRDLLIGELNHRVKNILALVRSITAQTIVDDPAVKNYAQTLQQRIAALATAHDMVGGSSSQWPDLHEMIHTELRPYLHGSRKVLVEGPDAKLRADVAPVIALLLHELVSNAVKHGALSKSETSLTVTWRPDSGGLMLQWKESGLSGVRTPSHKGFGLNLIERAVPFECRGSASIDFESDGLRGSFWLPSESVRMQPRMSRSSRSQTAAASISSSSEPAPDLTGLSGVLVVEDHMVIAMEMESLLREAGATDIYVVSTVADASRHAAGRNFALAILDINLAGEMSYGLAAELIDRGVPVIFVSGYADSLAEMPDDLRSVPQLAKPVEPDVLLTEIARVLAEEKS